MQSANRQTGISDTRDNICKAAGQLRPITEQSRVSVHHRPNASLASSSMRLLIWTNYGCTILTPPVVCPGTAATTAPLTHRRQISPPGMLERDIELLPPAR